MKNTIGGSMKRLAAVIVALFVFIALGGAQSPNAADQDFASVKLIANGTVVGSAKLVRNNNGITCVLHTSGLVPGDVYSVWWVLSWLKICVLWDESSTHYTRESFR